MTMTQSTTPATALAGMTCFVPQIEIWGGSVTFDPRPRVSEVARRELPPNELASNGRLFLIPAGSKRTGGNASPLAALTSLRKQVQRRLAKDGFPFLGGMMIPQAKTDTLVSELADLQGTFDQTVERFLQELPALYLQRRAEYPAWAGLLAELQPDPEKVRKAFRFRVNVFAIGEPSTTMAAEHCRNLASDALPALLADVAQQASEQLRRSFPDDRTAEVTQKAANPVRHLIGKLEAFGFVDPKVGPLVQLLQEQMASVPTAGPLTPAQEQHLVATLVMLANPEHLLAAGERQMAQATAPAAASTPPGVQQPLCLPETGIKGEIETPVEILPPAPPVQPTPTHQPWSSDLAVMTF